MQVSRRVPTATVKPSHLWKKGQRVIQNLGRLAKVVNQKFKMKVVRVSVKANPKKMNKKRSKV